VIVDFEKTGMPLVRCGFQSVGPLLIFMACDASPEPTPPVAEQPPESVDTRAVPGVEADPATGATDAIPAPQREGATTPTQQPVSEPCPPDMIFVPGGVFSSEEQRYIIKIFTQFFPYGGEYIKRAGVDDFCLARTEFTMGQWRRCVDAGQCQVRAGTRLQRELSEIDPNSLAPMTGEPDDISYLEIARICEAQGGRLPTLEEWMWAYWGGAEHRQYPWGDAKPSPDRMNICDTRCQVELIESDLGEGDADCTMKACKGVDRTFGTDPWPYWADVASLPQGAGRWGHMDLEGNVGEIVFVVPEPFSLVEDARELSVGDRYPPPTRAFFWVCGTDAGTYPKEIHEILGGKKFACSPGGSSDGFRCAATPHHGSSAPVRTDDTNRKHP
jgi:formylglycine-generating enzyme required for sulfatase activity